jgi:hypothetical protein
MMFRSLFLILLVECCQQLVHCLPHNNKILHHSIPSPAGSGISIVNVNVERHKHDDFTRIAEYFNGGTEHKGRRCIVRDDESVRAGLYFVVNFDRPLTKLPRNLRVNIYLMLGRSLTPEKFEFELPNVRQEFVAEVYCGITSKKIVGLKINAYKIEVLSDSGEIIASYRSHMWPKNL